MTCLGPGMENNIRQIRQVFKSLKLQNSRGSESREMSLKSSRAHSRRGSMDILEEEMMQINKDTMFPEEEEEELVIRSKSGSLFGSTTELHSLSLVSEDEDTPPGGPGPLSRRPVSRRPSIPILALPTGRWSRRSSLAGNEFLKMDDEVEQNSLCFMFERCSI